MTVSGRTPSSAAAPTLQRDGRCATSVTQSVAHDTEDSLADLEVDPLVDVDLVEGALALESKRTIAVDAVAAEQGRGLGDVEQPILVVDGRRLPRLRIWHIIRYERSIDDPA